jgi:hypothetical protein
MRVGEFAALEALVLEGSHLGELEKWGESERRWEERGVRENRSGFPLFLGKEAILMLHSRRHKPE